LRHCSVGRWPRTRRLSEFGFPVFLHYREVEGRPATRGGGLNFYGALAQQPIGYVQKLVGTGSRLVVDLGWYCGARILRGRAAASSSCGVGVKRAAKLVVNSGLVVTTVKLQHLPSTWSRGALVHENEASPADNNN
jgi:hypothetical protein